MTVLQLKESVVLNTQTLIVSVAGLVSICFLNFIGIYSNDPDQA
jgi:hypothetical protein